VWDLNTVSSTCLGGAVNHVICVGLLEVRGCVVGCAAICGVLDDKPPVLYMLMWSRGRVRVMVYVVLFVNVVEGNEKHWVGASSDAGH
jgi:hypothetical protein